MTTQEKTRVVNRHAERFDVYIGRGTPFGNTFVMDEAGGTDGTREEVITKFQAQFLKQVRENAVFAAQVEALRGQILGCSCKPLACHGDVIVSYLNGELE